MNEPTSESHENHSDKKLDDLKEANNQQTHKMEFIWPIIIIISFLHIMSVYGLYLVFTSAKIYTTLFAIFMYQFTMMGTTAGVHRLWAHRTYKANLPLRLLLLFMFSCSYQYSVIHWSRDHRVHHKFSDTDADPYNPKRGFIFSHMGWVFIKKRPDVARKGKGVDMSDLYSDPFLKFQDEYQLPVLMFCAFVLPTLIPMYVWNETFANAFYVAAALRWTVTSHLIGLVNSIAHIFGNKPYDKNSTSVQNLTASVLTFGEGWHNYHHAFPWDYKASEFGKYSTNSTTAFIDFFAWIGWAYDLKTVSDDLVKRRVERTGDGTHAVWGWNDQDMTNEEKNGAIIMAQQ